MDSMISWVGGKRLMRPEILKRFPAQYDRYIEVFGGAGWVLFGKEPEPFEVYNDLNSDLTNLFYVVKYRPLAFLEELGWLPLHGREEFNILMSWNKQQDFSLPHFQQELELAQRYLSEIQLEEYQSMLQTRAELGDVRRAVIFFKIIRESYASGCTSFNGQPVNLANTYKAIWLANRRLNENGNKSHVDRRLTDGKVGKGVIIENRSYESLISIYDRQSSFFYLDPPYYGTEKSYVERFTLDDHYNLRKVTGNAKGKWMISYNDCGFIRDLYKDYRIESFERLNSISQRYEPGNQFGELLIMNYDPEEPRQLSLNI